MTPCQYNLSWYHASNRPGRCNMRWSWKVICIVCALRTLHVFNIGSSYYTRLPKCSQECITWWRHQMETFSALLTLCVRGINWSPVNSSHKGQWRGALVFSLICTWTNGYANNQDPSNLRRHRSDYDITLMNQLMRLLVNRVMLHNKGLWPRQIIDFFATFVYTCGSCIYFSTLIPNLEDRMLQSFETYRQTRNISSTLLFNNFVDHSDVVGAPTVGAAPTTSSFST